MARALSFTVTTTIGQATIKVKKWIPAIRMGTDNTILFWAKWIKKSAKLRAPRFTGTLVSNIGYKKISRSHYQVGVYGVAENYAGYVEKGVRPHIIPTDYVMLHIQSPGTRGSWIINPSTNTINGIAAKFWLVGSSRGMGFMSKAVMVSKQRVPTVWEKKVIEKMRGG